MSTAANSKASSGKAANGRRREERGAQVEGARVQDATVMVSAIDPRIDPASRTVRLRLMLDNAGGTYRPGATLILQPPLPSQ